VIGVKSATKSIKIDEVDESIFGRKYFAHCLNCLFCDDLCCSHSCQIDRAAKDRILIYATELEARLAIPASHWFEEEVINDADYPSGEAMKIKVNRGRCVFYDHQLRGCYLHRFASENCMDWHLLKPMVCSLFPATWEKGRLFINSLLDELPCRNQGVLVFEAQKEELKFYFGTEFVSELESIAFQMTL